MDQSKDSFFVVPQEDRVKGQIYDYWVAANTAFRELTQQLLRNPKASEKALGKERESFIAAVLTLYSACSAKLRYQEKEPCVTELRKINADDFLYHPEDLGLITAKHIFVLLTSFLEVHGITRTEIKENVSQQFIRG